MHENKKNFKDFKSASLADWENAAREELKGSNPWEKLLQHGDGWSLQPYYDQTARSENPPALLPISQNTYLGARTWYNCPVVIVNEASEANQRALTYLRQGADGICFELTNKIEFESLLKNIEWQYCSLIFLAKEETAFFAGSLREFMISKQNQASLHGAFIGNSYFPELQHSGFRFTGIDAKSDDSPVREIITAFQVLLSIRQNENNKIIGPLAISTTIETDLFLSIAKLRAFRLVWERYQHQLAEKQFPLFIHARSLPWIDASYQPHGNMIKGTYAAIAAILGGCDSLTIEPEDSSRSMMANVAQQVSNILREESHFSKVADPVAGSYFVEELSRQLSDSAWKTIQTLLPA